MQILGEYLSFQVSEFSKPASNLQHCLSVIAHIIKLFLPDFRSMTPFLSPNLAIELLGTGTVGAVFVGRRDVCVGLCRLPDLQGSCLVTRR